MARAAAIASEATRLDLFNYELPCFARDAKPATAVPISLCIEDPARRQVVSNFFSSNIVIDIYPGRMRGDANNSTRKTQISESKTLLYS